MRSLHIDTARTWRGGQNQCLLTVNGLRAMGHETMLVAHPAGELRRRAPDDDWFAPLAPRFELDFHAAWKLARLLRAFRPQVVHAHDSHGVALGALALSFRNFDPAPMLMASRRVDFRLRSNTFSRFKNRRVRRFICASDAIRRILEEDGIEPERLVTVHDGIDLEQVKAAPPVSLHETFRLPKGTPVVLNVAAMAPHKGQRHLVEAMRQVVHAVPDARLVILGEGALRASLERQAGEIGLGERVLMPGFRQDVLSLLKTCDVFVLSSVTEGLGTSLLDAMACARPVVGTRAGGIPEVVIDGETGLVVPPENAAALAAAMIELLTNPGRAHALAAAGFERVQRFSADRMVRDTLAVYDDSRAGSHA